MTDHGRKYGNKPSYPICVWNGIFDHYQKIGPALWEFLWCIDKITIEENGVGCVLGGAPVKVARIAKDFGVCEKTIRIHLSRLKVFGYISTKKTPFGLTIGVKNSKKVWGSSGKNLPQDSATSGKNLPERPEKNYRSKEDKAVDKAAAAPPAAPDAHLEDSVWGFLRISPCGPISFRTLLESRWASRNGEQPSVLIGGTVDAWETAEGAKLHHVPQLFRALSKLRQMEKEKPPIGKEASKPIHIISPEEIPA